MATASTTARKNTGRTTSAIERTAAEADRTVRMLARDSAYATVGAGDSALAFVRRLPVKAEQLASPKQLRANLTELAATVETRFDALATRGRGVVEAITSNDATAKAVARTRSARGQVKAAATSLRKAVNRSATAVDEVTEQLADAS